MSEEKKNENSETEESSLPGILYIGEDLGFWNDFQRQFLKDYGSIGVEFKALYHKNKKHYQADVYSIVENRYKLILIDFSKQTEELIHLARIFGRLDLVIQTAVIGLVDYKCPQEMFELAIMSGCHSVHIKSGEFEGVVLDSVNAAFKDKVESHDFVKAQLNDNTTAYIPVKVGVISPIAGRIESPLPFNNNEMINIHTYWSRQNIIKDPLAKIINNSSEDLYYCMNYAQELVFEMVPPLQVFEDSPADVVEKKTQERNANYEAAKEEMIQWITKNDFLSKKKTLKVLVVDKDLCMYKNDLPSDSYTFTLRCQRFLRDEATQLLKMLPQFIFYSIEDVSQEDLDAASDMPFIHNTKRNFAKLVQSLKRIEDYEPYIVAFNAGDMDTELIRKDLNYPSLMCFKAERNAEAVLKMSKSLEAKLLVDQEDYENTLYLDKNSPQSYAEVEVPVTLLSCSELDIYFKCDKELPPGTKVKFWSPANFNATVVLPPKDSPYPKDYYGVISGIGEEKRQKLRQFVNSVFFRALEEQKKAEKEEFEALQKKGLMQKLHGDEEGDEEEEE